MKKLCCIIIVGITLSTALNVFAQDDAAQCDTCQAELKQKITDAIKENTPKGTTVTVSSAPATELDNTQTTRPAGAPPSGLPKFELKHREFDDREKITLLLNAHCDFPSKEDLLSTSPDAEKHIQAIIQDETVLESVRQRALEALAYFNTPENEASLRKTLEDSYNSPNVFSIVYAIRAYSLVAGENSVPLVERFLTHPHDYVRLAAISNLKLTPGNAALNALKNRRQVETNRFFISRLDQAIEQHCRQKTRCVDDRRF